MDQPSIPQESAAQNAPHSSATDAFTLAVLVGLLALVWAGFNAWSQTRAGGGPLDLDGWGHLIPRLDQSGHRLSSIFRDPSVWKGPIVPTLFGLSYYVAPFKESVLVFNALAFGVAAACFFLGFRLLGAGTVAAVTAVLAWVFYLPHRTVFGYYFAEPVLSLLAALLFLLAIVTIRTQSAPWAAATGGLAAVLLLARAPYVAVVAGLPLLFLMHLGRHRRWRIVAVYSVAALTLYLPWPIRNYAVHHELIPFTTEGGKILFQGTYLRGKDGQQSTIRQIPEYVAIERAAAGKSDIEQYRYWRQLAIDQIKADPMAQVAMCLRKAVRFWVYLRDDVSWPPAWKTTAVALLCLPLSIVAIGRRRDDLLVQMAALWVGGLWLIHSILHAELRYNFPVLPMAFVLASLGAIELLKKPGRANQ